MRAYAELYDAGYVHSFEVWDKDGELVGGGYGVALGGVFVIEFAILARVEHLEDRLLGAQLASREMGLPHERQQAATPSLQMGFRVIPRGDICATSPCAWHAKASRVGGRSRPAPSSSPIGTPIRIDGARADALEPARHD